MQEQNARQPPFRFVTPEDSPSDRRDLSLYLSYWSELVIFPCGYSFRYRPAVGAAPARSVPLKRNGLIPSHPISEQEMLLVSAELMLSSGILLIGKCKWEDDK